MRRIIWRCSPASSSRASSRSLCRLEPRLQPGNVCVRAMLPSSRTRGGQIWGLLTIILLATLTSCNRLNKTTDATDPSAPHSRTRPDSNDPTNTTSTDPTDATHTDYDRNSASSSNGSVELVAGSRTRAGGAGEPEHRLTPAEHLEGHGDRAGGLEARVEEATTYGLKMMDDLYKLREPELYKMGLWLDRNEPASHVAAFSAPSERAQKLARYGYAALQAARKLTERLGTWEAGGKGRVSLDEQPELRERVIATALHEQCPLRGTPRCRAAARRYRTSDGTCNNLQHPWRGSALTPAQRFLPPHYDDGLETVRRSSSDIPLPSAREISVRVHRDRDRQAHGITLMLMQWGQLVDHDIVSTAQARAFNGSVPRCCTEGGRAFQPPEFMHPDCLPIAVSKDDWFLSRFGVRCLEFIRSAPASRIDCHLGWREQINQVTSFLDASTIYGSTPEQTDSIRLFRSGQLVYGRENPQNPPDPPGGELCRKGAITSQCMRPADGRMSEQPALTALHITWVRYHNTIAALLTKMNPHWSDEKTFQESRRIVGAMIQHITYREFLPVVLGLEVLRLFDLEVLPKGYYKGYNPKIRPTPASSFTTAAFRFGHSLVQRSFMRSDSFHRPLFNNVTLHEEQLNAENIWSFGSVDRLLLGLCNQPSQTRDEFMSEELTNHLFQTPGFPFGMDLAAINIQRGRDHGLPPYVQWRVPCGLSAINNWTDLHHVMSLETSNRLHSLYQDVQDIDLFTGGMAERPVRGGLVGPTFACIIAQQFHNLRSGDRFWYENDGFESSFTPAQLQQIRKITLAQILCETMDEVSSVQPFVFLAPDDHRNRRERCRNLLNFDLNPWIEDNENGIRRFNRVSRSADKKHKNKTKSNSQVTVEKNKAIIINLTNSEDVQDKAIYGTYYYTPEQIPNRPTYRPRPQTTYSPYFNAKPTRTTKRPNSVTLVVNSNDHAATTVKPNYNVNIQINYYFNGSKPVVTKPSDEYDDPEPYNPNPGFSYGDSNFYSQIPSYPNLLDKPNKQTVTVWSTQGIIQPTNYNQRPNVYEYRPQTHRPTTNKRPSTPNKVYYNTPTKRPREPYVVLKNANVNKNNKLAEYEIKDLLDLHLFDLDEIAQDDDKKYVKISSNKVLVRGKTNDQTKVNKTIQTNRRIDDRVEPRQTVDNETDHMTVDEMIDDTPGTNDTHTDDLDMTYSEIFEQFIKPDNVTFNKTVLTQNNKWTVYNVTDEEIPTEIPLPQQTDQIFSVELPKPFKLFDGV